MRNFGIFVILLIALTTTAFAQQNHRISLFLNNPQTLGAESSQGKTHWYGGFGAAIDTMFTPRISGQIAVALEQHRSYPYVVEANGAITPVEPIELRT